MKQITRASIRKIMIADEIILRFFPIKKRKNMIFASVPDYKIVNEILISFTPRQSNAACGNFPNSIGRIIIEYLNLSIFEVL